MEVQDVLQAWHQVWIKFVIFLLGVTVSVKLLALAIAGRFLGEIDPVSGFTNREVVIFSIIVESLVVAFLLGMRRVEWVRYLPSMFGIMALAYRVLALSKGHDRCPCLGGIFGSNRLLTEYEPYVLTAIALFLVVSYPISQIVAHRISCAFNK